MGDTRSLDRARGRIERVASELDVPAPTEQMAQQLLDTVHEELDTDGRRMDVLGAAALSLSCKHQKLPVTPEMVSQMWGAETDDAYGDFETKLLHRRLETVRDATGLNPPPTEPTELVEGYRESLGVPEQVTESTREILEQLMVVAPEEVTGGTSPSGNAAGALYIAVCELGLRQDYTQSDIADAGGVTEVTIRKRYQRIAEALGGQPVLDDEGRVVVDGEEGVTAADGEEGVTAADDEEGVTAADDETELGGASPDGESPARGSGAATTDSGGDALEPGSAEVVANSGGDAPELGSGEDGDDSEREEDRDDSEREEDRDDSEDAEPDDSLELSIGAYAVLRRATADGETDEAETLVESLREATKQLLDGREFERHPRDGGVVPVSVDLPRRVEQFLTVEVDNPETEFESVGELADAAVLEQFGGASSGGTEPVWLRGDVLTAARHLVDVDDQYQTVDELLRGGAVELLSGDAFSVPDGPQPVGAEGGESR